MKSILLTPETFQNCLGAGRSEFQTGKKYDITLSLNRMDEQKTSNKDIGKTIEFNRIEFFF